ncbi:MAG: hypothetical protein LBC70_08315 [Chitinispirillales bacterium]|jgi:hypothetical protein|nr:hypothetical protein [Chitinispirillales bacterium]
MATIEKDVTDIFVDDFSDLPEVEYPAEVVERWLKIAEITEQHYATGEIEDTDLEGLAAEIGVSLEDV